MGAWPELLVQTAALTQKDKACQRYLRGEALLQDKTQERSAEALSWLEPLASDKNALGEWAQYRKLEALLRGHKHIKQKPAFGHDFPWSVQAEALGLAVTLPAAEAVEKMHALQPRDAKARQVTAELILQLAPADSVARRTLFTEFPDSKLAPLAYPPATVKDLRARAAVLSDKHMNSDVLKTSDAAMTMSPTAEERCAFLFYKGAALRKLRKYKPSEDVLVSVRESCVQSEFYKRAWYLLGQVQVIAESAAVATKTLTDFGAAFPGDALVDDALFLLAVTAEKAGDKPKAIALYDKVAALEPPGDQCAEATFRAAYARYAAGNFAEALPLMDRIASGARCSDDYEKARGLYWQSRTRDRLHAPEVKAPLEQLVSEQPLSWYGLLARSRLGEPAVTLEVPSAASQPVSDSAPALFKRTEAVRALALAAQGLYVEAQAELGAFTPAPSELLGQAQLLASAFDFYHSHLLVRTQLKSTLGTIPTEANLNAWLLAYPRPFADTITESEKREALPDDFELSMIREESAFMLDVGSWANAFGLTQLLVDTANDTARDMKTTPPTADQLKTDARLSIVLGAHHLAMLRRRAASPALILAAYNAGMGSVKKWQGQRGEKPADEFIEEIPLDETRGYVKRIYRSWAVYRTLAGAPLPQIDAAAPLR